MAEEKAIKQVDFTWNCFSFGPFRNDDRIFDSRARGRGSAGPSALFPLLALRTQAVGLGWDGGAPLALVCALYPTSGAKPP